MKVEKRIENVFGIHDRSEAQKTRCMYEKGTARQIDVPSRKRVEGKGMGILYASRFFSIHATAPLGSFVRSMYSLPLGESSVMPRRSVSAFISL